MAKVTAEQVVIIPGRRASTFTFYDGDAAGVPMLDIGVLFADAMSIEDVDAVAYQVVGDTDDAFTVFLKRNGYAHTIALTFTTMSFGEVPVESPPMHKAQYKRFHMVVMDFIELKQLNVPFNVPDELMYSHERGVWGIRVDGQSSWSANKEDVFESIRVFVEPVVRWLAMVDTKF